MSTSSAPPPRTWRSAATGLDVLVHYCDLAVGGLSDERSPEIALAVDATRELKEALCEMAEQYGALGSACEQYADQVEEQRAALLDFLWDLLRDTLIIEGAGIFLGFVTGGAAAYGATALNTARIAEQLPRIMAFVELVRSAAAAAVGVIRVAGQALGRVRVVLEKFTGVVFAGNARALTVSLQEVRLSRIQRTFRDPRVFDPEDLRGMDSTELRQILRQWETKPTKGGGGDIYIDPDVPGRQIRLMPGYLHQNRPSEITHGPYVVVSQNGDKFKIPLEGNPLL